MMDNDCCDVGTQTIDKNFKKSVRRCEGTAVQRANGHVLHSSSKRGRKSSFRLFLLQDDPGNKKFHDPGIRFSLDGRSGKNGESLSFSVVASEVDGRRTIETWPDSKNPGNNKRRYRNTFKQSELSKHSITGSMSSLKFDRDNSAGTIDHQLNNSSNPSILAWLRLKNFEEREKRRLREREKKELRRLAYAEAERRQKRIEESEKYFAQWLSSKKKEARRAWREKRARSKVDTVESEDTITRHSEYAPPNYTAVPTFKGVQAWTEEEISFDTDRTESSKNETNEHLRNEVVAENVLQTKKQTVKPTSLLQTHLNADTQQISTNRNMADNNTSEQVKLDKVSENYVKRPVTADHGFISSGESNCAKRNKQKKHSEQESNIRRPSTSGVRLKDSTDTKLDKGVNNRITFEEWIAHKKQKRTSKRTPPANNVSHRNIEGGRKSTINKSITFEAWKEQKRQETKQNVKKNKQEVVDDSLTEAIIKIARKRVENSRNEKRQLDTGMPKWRSRNRVKNCSEKKNTGVQNTPASKYSLIQFLVNEHDNCETRETGVQTEAEGN